MKPTTSASPRPVDDRRGDDAAPDAASKSHAVNLAHNRRGLVQREFADAHRLWNRFVAKWKMFDQVANRANSQNGKLVGTGRPDTRDESHIGIEG